MANKILHKRNNVSGQEPLSNQIDLGEIAINTADGKMFIKQADGTIKDITQQIEKGDTRVVVNDEGNGVVTMEIDGVEKLRIDGTNVYIADDLEIDNQGSVKFKEQQSFGTNSVNVKASATMEGSYDIILPDSDAKKGQVLQNVGFGQTQWSDPGGLAGNRIYVSSQYGDDNNDGKLQPVKTIKRASQIASDGIFTPVTDPGQSAYDAKDLLEQNRDFLQDEVVAFSTNAFNIQGYDQTKCERDVGLIIDAFEHDLRYGGDAASSVAGAFYALESSALVKQAQDVATEYSLRRIQEIAKAVVTNTVVTELTQAGVQQQFDGNKTATATEVTAVDVLGQKVIDYYIDGVGVIPNEIKTSDVGLLNAETLLDANQQFIKDEVVAFLANKYSGFEFDAAKCSRDTGLIIDAVNYDLLYSGTAESHYAGITYLNAAASLVRSDQKQQTLAGINYARDLAKQIIAGQDVKYTYQTAVTQDNTLQPGTSIEVQEIDDRFSIIYGLLNNGIGTSNGTITTDTGKLNSDTLIQQNTDFIKEEVIGYLSSQYQSTYDETKCRRDSGLIIDAVSYDTALGTNYNSVTAGLAYTRANTAYLQSNQLTLTDNAIGELGTDIVALSDVSGSTTATNRVNTGIAEIRDILNNGAGNADALTFPTPTGASQDLVDAKDQLQANRAFLIAEVTAYISNTYPAHTYNVTACERDTGYIVDALTYDILYGGNSATIQAAEAYFVGTTSQLGSGEATITADSYNFLAGHISNVVQGIAVTAEQAVVGQDFSSGNATSTEGTTLDGLVQIIEDVITAGSIAGLPSTTTPSISWATQELQDAFSQIQNNKTGLINDTIDYVDANLFVYDQNKCRRDVGLLLDALRYDFTHGGNNETIQAALSYYTYSASTALNSQLTETLDGINYAYDLAKLVIVNQTPATSYQALYNQFTDVGNPGDAATQTIITGLQTLSTDIITDGDSTTIGLDIDPNNSVPSVDSNVQQANAILAANREFIRAETVAFIEENYGNFNYDSATCSRDVGLIVDAVKYDLEHGGDAESIFAGLTYYNNVVSGQSQITGDAQNVVNKQLQPTIDAIEYARDLLANVVLQTNLTGLYQNTTTQTFDGANPSNNAAAQTVYDLANKIYVTVKNGVGTSNNVDKTTNTGALNSETLIESNRLFITEEVIGYINNQYPALTYDQTSCRRDTGLILDALQYDLTHGGNTNTIVAGAAYYKQAAAIVVSGQKTETIAALNHLKSLVQDVVRNVTISTTYSAETQVFDGVNPGDTTSAQTLGALMDVIVDVVDDGVSDFTNITANGALTTDQDILNAGALITSNKTFIQDETVAYVDASWITFGTNGYNQALCQRDIGYILDAFAFDLTWGGTSNTTAAAISYFKQSSSVALQRQLVQTIDGIMHGVRLAKQVVENYDVTSFQINSSQVTDPLNPGSQAAIDKIDQLGTILEDIIIDGVSTAVTVSASGIVPSSNQNVINAADLLALNRSFIQAEVISYINTNFTNFTYDVDFCRRDVGLFINAIQYDLVYGGNERAIEAGKSYYIGNTIVIPGEEFQTVLANRYFQKLVNNVLQNIENKRLYQNTAGQVTDVTKIVEPGTLGIVEAEFDIIIDIIENGPQSPNIPTEVEGAFNINYTTIMVATGEYKEDNPVIIPDYVSIVGDNLRTTIVRPLNANQDIFRVRNGCYLLGITFKDGLDAFNVPSFTGRFCTAFDDPFDTGVDRTGYVGLREKPIITQSPYVQNVSIISFLGLSGCLVDGSKVITPNIPRFAIEAENPVFGETPEQGKSMVANAYTMLSFGGTGWRLTNDAYAQIVSCFQIFLGNGCWCQSGAYLSVTNSATNFGLYALRSSGYSANSFVFDRGVIAEVGNQASQQKLITVGTKRTPVNQFILRFYDDDEENNLANDITNNFKTIPNILTFNAASVDDSSGTLDLEANTITIVGHGLVTGDAVTYRRNGNVEINGLADQGLYYVEVLTNDIIRLFQDDSREFVADLLEASTGDHILETQTEEFFIDELILDADGNKQTHNKYQVLTLAPGSYTFNPGDLIEATTGIYRNKAYVYTYDQATRTLTVSVEKAENSGQLTRIFFDATSVIDSDSSAVAQTNILVTGFTSRTDLFTAEFTIDPTIVGGVLTNTGNLPGTYVRLHRPSIVNSSAHTWEYAGSGTDYNALPQNGGITREEYEQFSDLPGRVYSSGTNELGDFKVGDFIVAENRTGNITFKNTVTVGELSALKLAVSDVVIEAISTDPGLGDNEPGGATDTRLTTQLAQRSFMANRLGDFLDKNVSTNSLGGAVPQMNAQGLLNADIIPATRNFSLFNSDLKYGRLDLTDDIPAQQPLQGDIASEKYPRIFFTLSAPTTLSADDVVVEANTGATAIVDEDNGGAATVYLTNITGTFSNNISANTLVVNGGNTTTYITNTGSTETREVQYTLVSDSTSEYLKYSPSGASFTNGVTITAAGAKTQGTITSQTEGVLIAVDNGNISGGQGYVPVSGTQTYENVPMVANTGVGTGAIADITVTNGIVSNVDLTRGGTGYQTGDILTAATSNLGGSSTTAFQIAANGVENRLYIDLIEGKFTVSTTNNDYIEDSNATITSVAIGNTTLTAFNADTVPNGGNVDYANSRITINAHIFDDGDIVNYASSPNTPIGGLLQGESYFVKVLDANTIELYNRYDLDPGTKVSFTTSSTGTHALIIKHVDTRKDRIYAPSHGYTTGQAFRFVSTNPPTGMVSGNYYFVGSVTANGFTVHEVQQDAVESVNGLTQNNINFVQTGSGSADFVKQNITIYDSVNTSSKLDSNWALTGSANVDASNIVSGVISTSRLAAVGSANDKTYLKGDSSWDYAVRTARIALNSPLNITGDFYTSGGQNYYYANTQFDIDRTDDTLGNQSFTNLGVAAFSKAQFNVNAGEVELKAGVLDAGTLDGLDSQYFLEPGNLLNPVPVNRGGTALDQYIAGDMIYATSPTTLNRLPIGSQGAVMVVDQLGNPAWSNDVAPFTEDTNNTGVARPLEIRHEVTNTPAVGIGVGMQFQVETANNNRETGAVIDAVATDVTFGSEDFSLKFGTMAAGFLQERMVLDSLGNLQIDGDLNVDGGDIKTTKTSATVYDNTVTALSIGRAATSVTIGADKSGTMRVRNTTLVVGGDDTETQPANATIKAPNGLGTNKNGPDLTITGGGSTGNGDPGRVYVRTSSAGTSGSALRTQVDRVEIGGVTDHTPSVYLGRSSQNSQQIATLGVKGPITGQFNINGSVLELKPGSGTGSGAGAAVEIYGSNSIGSGSGIQNQELVASFSGDAIRLNKNVITQASSLGTNQAAFDLLNDTVTTLNIGGAATAIDIGAASGYLHVNSADQATSTTTGALRVDGGGSFSKNLYVGGQLSAADLSLTGAVNGNSYNVNGVETIDSNRRFISSGGTTGQIAKVHAISFDWDGNYGSLGGYTNHGISSRSESWIASDDLSINSYHNVNIRLDSNSNNSAATTFLRVNNDVSQTNGNICFSVRGDGKVGINKDPGGTYNLDVNGSFNATTGYINGGAIWTASNDGEGSGLNADLLDGLHASSFLRVDTGAAFSGGVFKISGPATTIQNTGEVNTLQCYQGNGANSYDAFMTFHIGGDYAVHFGLDGTTNDLAMGGWSRGAVAHRVWHAGNDGSSSGLDADLLDGQEGSFYRNASNINAGTFPDRFSNSTRYNIGFIDGYSSSNYDKLRVYGSSSYTIGMASGQTHGWLNDWAMTFTMNNESDRGWKWRDTDDGVAAGAMSLTTNGNLCVGNVVAVGGQTTRYLSQPSGNYGSIQINGSGAGNWEGFSIDGRAVFMHDGGSSTGIYNDVNNHWLFYAVHGGSTEMRYNNSNKINTRSNGVDVNGELYLNNWLRIESNSGIYWQAGSYAGWHIYPQASNRMHMRSASSGSCEVTLCNSSNTIYGRLYADNDSQGFLNEDGNWALRSYNNDGVSPGIRFYENSNESWTGNPGNDVGKIEYHSNRFYIAAGANSNRVCQFRRDGTDVSYVDNSGVYQGTAASANWADLAEKYEADTVYEHGTVLAIGGDKEVTRYEPGMKLAGVVSTLPGLMMNQTDENRDDPMWPFVALKGRVPCLINGTAKKGQYIIANQDGKGRAVDTLSTIEEYTLLIGTAISDCDGEGTVEVKV